MGWKSIKEHYGIKHIVCVVPSKGVCIGSAYVHDLITISESDRKMEWRDSVDRKRFDIGEGLVVWRPTYVGRGQPFDGWVATFQSDPAELRRLLDAPDFFERSIPVFTYDYDGNIIEKQCEELGWPNCTHDGLLMYDNSFFPTRDKAIAKGRRELAACVTSVKRNLEDARSKVTERETWLRQYEAALAKLGGAPTDSEEDTA